MNLTRCENGHFYDSERFDTCPHCNQTSISTVIENSDGDKEYTLPLGGVQDAGEAKSGLEELVVQVKGNDVEVSTMTVGYFGDINVEPVVGWLVSIEGSNFGTDFRLKSGRNFIGRSPSMDVSLTEDNSISREKHAIVVYEPKGNIFLVQPGDAKELFYLNDRVVLNAVELNAYDVLSLGNTKLMFVPCCCGKFNWDAVKPKEDK